SANMDVKTSTSMMSSSDNPSATAGFVDPFDALIQLDEMARKKKQAAVTTEIAPEFTGIAFQADTFKFIIARTEIAEIITKPNIVEIPGVKAWLLGLVNHHGNILLVTDLWDFLYGRKEPVSDTAKVIIVEQESDHYGLLIDHCYGIKRLKKTQLKPSDHTLGLRGDIEVFIDGYFEDGDDRWLLLNVKKIIATPAFRRVSKEENQRS
ncbi:MAG: chemotaxis protein CheW, partial [Pseudomonadota bacterium]